MSVPWVESEPLSLRLHRNHLYVEAALFNAHFPHVHSIALLRKGGDLLIFPLAASEAGGFYVKQINARGDRAIHAADFFRRNGIDENHEYELTALPQPSMAGFIVPSFFA